MARKCLAALKQRALRALIGARSMFGDVGVKIISVAQPAAAASA